VLSRHQNGSLLSRNELRDGLKLHVARPLVDFSDLGVTVEFFYGVLARETDATEQVDGL
jgi:hypothetical protein